MHSTLLRAIAALATLTIFSTLLIAPASAGTAPQIAFRELGSQSPAQRLDGATVKGDLRLLIQNDTGVSEAVFHVDQPESGQVHDTDASSKFTTTLDTSTLVDGEHKVIVLLKYRKTTSTVTARFVTANGNVPAPAPAPAPAAPDTGGFSLLSRYPGSSSDPVDLDGVDLTGETRIIARPNDNVAKVSFWVDGNSSTPTAVADSAPYLFWLDTAGLVDGTHTISASVETTTGARYELNATFTTTNGTAPAPAPESELEPMPEPVEGVGDGPRDDVSPAPVPSSSWSGLHVTEAELAEWRRRIADGVYVKDGDVTTNSPGDWTRITANAESFLRDPSAGRWAGPTKNNPNGCVLRDGGQANDPGYQPPVTPADELRDAAFTALLTGDASMAAAVKAEIMAQAAAPGVNFANTARWCTGKILDGSPGFMIATWLTKYLFAADYLRTLDADAFSAREWATLSTWFSAAAEWMAVDTDLKLDEMFIDRPNGDYRLSSAANRTTAGDRVIWAGGPEARVLHRRFNNRNSREVRFVTLVGIQTDNERFIEHGKRYVQDALAYSYFPEGGVGDFERWTDSMTLKGWKYGVEFVGTLVTIADHLARDGDGTLYEYSTTAGAQGTEGRHHSGAPKSLETLVSDMLGYVDGRLERYAGSPSVIGKAAYRIDTVDERNNYERVNDTSLAMANRWFRDDRMEELYTRRAPGAPSYPSNVDRGSGEPWGGEAGIYPGALFMFGQMEDVTSPYPGR